MTLDELRDTMARAADGVNVGRAFGTPVERDGCTIIPVAWVVGGGGGGIDATSGGAGSGFGGVTWPLGVYEVRDGRVRWVPAVDATRVVLGGLALARAVVRLRRRRR